MHNTDCFDKIKRFPSRGVADRADELFHTNNRAGASLDFDNGGRVELLGDVHRSELRFASELAEATGKKVQIRGRKAKGADLIIEGIDELTELKTLENRTARAVQRQLDEAGSQGKRTIIDGRDAKLTRGTALQAVRGRINNSKITPNSDELIIFTTSGPVRVRGAKIIGN